MNVIASLPFSAFENHGYSLYMRTITAAAKSAASTIANDPEADISNMPISLNVSVSGVSNAAVLSPKKKWCGAACCFAVSGTMVAVAIGKYRT
ncbi:hypothetical protein LP421_10505 [Rhizobium sp. RCAM05350]|nr:hypothetical protein LP421_10505 [Rhizobium sp. RCAM05350]